MIWTHLPAQQGLAMTASLPYYVVRNVDQQRGRGVFASIRALQRLNRLGYGSTTLARLMRARDEVRLGAAKE
jgi:hypothetical protein